jgi:hypothetical protein
MPNKPIPDGNRALPKKPHDSHSTDEDSMSNDEDFNEDFNQAQEIRHTTPKTAPGDVESESMVGTSSINLLVSKTLKKRLEQSAREEGVSVDDLASELLAEGLVLRAWEIVERKSAMRSGGSPQQQQQQQQRQGNVRQGHSNKPSGYQGGGNNAGRHGGGGGGGGGGAGRMNKRHAAHATSLNVMEDKAAFLEYVRNQERKNR